LKTRDFDYPLPEERIAQTPIEPRHSSRLLVLNRANSNIQHRKFFDIGEFLNKNDLLVINRTKVIPARIFAEKDTGGKVEVLLLRQIEDGIWECLVGGKRIYSGKILHINNGPDIRILKDLEGSKRLIKFDEPVEPFLKTIGQMPLPPYIHQKLSDPDRYQTVFAKQTGSAAAPTAGLHFTNELMNQLNEQGINFCEITLHVGLDTFAPVIEDNALEHKIHSEWCEISESSANQINATAKAGGRIVAVGTTSVRTLETGALHAVAGEKIGPYSGSTKLFILPGYKFKVVDAMITNFHLPKSTLLMLVSAFASREQILGAYRVAINKKYRFYSFGDAMLIY
jgi:S-adenosylmethionine:tRNA ribosyltransferase-isomerase